METTNAPVTISNVTMNNSTRYNTQNVTVTITTSGTPSAQEKIFVRHTTDAFANSSLVEAGGSGTSWTAVIPGTASNSTQVEYYVLTSTVAGATVDDDFDLWTLRGATNGSANYKYTLAVAAAPTVSTNTTATSISTTGATLGGNITATGGPNSTTRGFEYSTSNNFGNGTGTTATDSGDYGTGGFSKAISSLSVNTQYYYRAQATNLGGTGRGAQQSFWTLANTPSAPTVGTPTASTLNVSINENSNPASTQFAIRQGSNYVQANGSLGATAVWQTKATWGTVTVTGLAANTSYAFDVKARNGANTETTFSSTASATTSASATAPLAPTITSITPGNGNLSVAFTAGADGGSAITNYHFSTNDGSTWTAVSPAATTSPILITGLANGTPYTVRIRAINAIGNGTQSANSTSTPRTTPGAPTITSITPGNGNLTVNFTAPASDGGNATTNYQYSTNGGANWQNRASGTTASPLLITTLSTDGSTGLTNGTTYNIQIRAVNAAGSGTATANSTGTPRTTPSVTTGSASSVGITTVTLGGDITSIGGNSATTRGVEYSTTNNFSTGTGTQVSSSGTFGTGSYTQAITGLAKNTTYYFRAYATNAAGTTYGSQASFTTLNAPDGRNPIDNTNPTTSFLGESPNLHIRAWQSFNAVNRSYATVFGRFGNADLTSSTIEGDGRDPGAADADFYAATPRFSQTGTFYWAMRVSYGSDVNYFFDASRADWSTLATSLPSAATLSITVNPLNDPTSINATAASATSVNLSWANGVSGNAKQTIIFRSTSATPPTLSQGTSYTAGTDYTNLGGGHTYRCISLGSGTSLTDTGLTAGQTYHYYFFAENWSYYSPGTSASVSLSSDYTYNIASGSTTESANLGGSGNLTKTGAGELVLTGVNTYSGNTTISSGTLRINADNGLGTAPGTARANSISLGSAKLALDGNFTLDSNRGITLTSTGAILDDFGKFPTYNGIIASSGTTDLEKRGGGTTTLGGANTYTGNTTINAGALEITHSSALGAGGAGNITTVSNGFALRLSNNVTVANELLTLSGVGSGSGGLISVTGNNTWSAAITLAANSRITSEAGTLTLGSISGGANVLYFGVGNATIGGVLSGDGGSQDGTTTSLFKDGSGLLTLTAANSYTGDTRITAGNLTISGSGTLGSGSDIFISNGGQLNVNSSATVASIGETGNDNGGIATIGTGVTLTVNGENKGTRYQNSISGAGGLTMSGSGNTTLSLYGTQSYTGTTTVTGGTLTSSVALATPNISVSGGRFALTGSATAASANITVSSAGDFSLTEITDGTISLAASKILTATTGTLTTAASKNFSLGSGSMVINSYGGNASALTLAGTGGEFQLESRGITVNTSSALAAGTYKLIAKSGSANVTGTPGSLTMGGSGLAAGTSAALSVSGGELILTVSVIPPVVTGATYAGTVGTAFSQSVSATGSPTSYAVQSGTLPAGLSLNATTGAITGTPTAAGLGTSVTINATNAGGAGNASFTFNIAKGASTISVTGSTSFTYNASPQGPDGHSKTGSTGAVTFSYNGTGGTVYSASATKPTNVGSYLATATVAADSNYEAQTSATYAFAITAASQTITFGALDNKTYGDSSFSLTANASSGLSVSYTSSNTSVATISGNTVTIVAPGTTTITASQAGNSNYSAAASVNQTLTVNTKALTVTTPAVTSKTYDGTTAATITGTLSGIVGGDTVTLTGTGNFSSANVGNGISVTSTSSLGGAHAARYTLTQPTGLTGNITAAAITITAGNQTKNFGSSSSTSGTSSDVSVTSGALVSPDAISTVTLTYSGAGNSTTARAGTYTITPSALALSPGNASNYAVTYANGTLTINPVAPAVTTGAHGSVTTTAATITDSNVTSDGGGDITGRGIVYGSSANPTLGGSNTTVAHGSNSTGTFTSELTGLTASTTYHYRAYVTNGNGTAYGTSASFTTQADVPAKVTLSSAHSPIDGGFTVAWTNVANETGYHLHYSTNSTFSSVTAITDIAADTTSRALTGLTNGTTYYIRVRGVSAGGNGTWSDTQVVQLRALAANSTAYLAPAGSVSAETVAGIFGASNSAGLASGANQDASTVIMLLNDAGATAHTIFYSTANAWRGVGTAETSRASEAMPAGKAFMIRNNTGSTDYFLLNAEPRTAPVTVSVNATTGQMNLLTPARSVPTTLNSLNLTAGGDNTSTGIKRASAARDADVIMIQNASGRFMPYHFDGTNWKINRTTVDPSTITVPAGGAFYIRKGPGSNFNSYELPSE